MGNLTFDEERHEYAADGVIVPSVTQIIRFLAYDTAVGANPSMRDAAADRGSRIHEACTAFDIDRNDAEIDGDIVGYVQAYATFLRDYSLTGWDMFETPLCATLDPDFGTFAGTIDRYGIVDGVSTLVDIKTGTRNNDTLHRAQLAGYRMLLVDNGYTVERSAILHLRRNGTYVFSVIPMLDAAATKAFLLCLLMNNYIEEARKCHKN